MSVVEKALENRLPAPREVVPGFLSMEGFELAQRAAKLLASSSLVPKDYQNHLPNCVIALNMAARMNSDPLMIMQNLHIVNGRTGWSSQFLISTFNTCGRFSALRYEWDGQPDTDNWGCRAWAIEKATGERLVGATVTIGIAKKEGWYSRNGSKWQTMPQQMLMYRAASWFVRAYSPELANGMQTSEELVDVYDLPSDSYRVVAQDANSTLIDIEPPKADVQQDPKPEPEVKATEAQTNAPDASPQETAAAAPEPAPAIPASPPLQTRLPDAAGPGY